MFALKAQKCVPSCSYSWIKMTPKRLWQMRNNHTYRWPEKPRGSYVGAKSREVQSVYKHVHLNKVKYLVKMQTMCEFKYGMVPQNIKSIPCEKHKSLFHSLLLCNNLMENSCVCFLLRQETICIIMIGCFMVRVGAHCYQMLLNSLYLKEKRTRKGFQSCLLHILASSSLYSHCTGNCSVMNQLGDVTECRHGTGDITVINSRNR